MKLLLSLLLSSEASNCPALSTMRVNSIHIINDGAQIIGFSGSTLFGLEKKLEKFNREPHSVIGSSCIGASIVGGVCNNSGGALVKRGPE